MEYSWSWYWIPPVVVLFIIIWRVIRARRLQAEAMRRQQESSQDNQTDQNNQVFVVQPGNP
jgi:flagellar biosynthesis/type III secretory pathway M-ring protein FliF/YscJ